MLRIENPLRSLWMPTSWALLAAALHAAPQEKDKDTVVLVSGATATGTIESEDWGGLSIKEKGVAKLVPWAEVASVSYGDAPEDFDPARSAADGGRLGEAKAGLLRVKDESDLRPVLRQQVLFHLAWVEQRTNDTEAALGHSRELLKTFPKGRYLRPAAENVAFALLAKGDVAGASAFLDQVAQAANDPGPQAEIALVRGHLFEMQKKVGEARAQYESAEKASATSPAVRQEAKLGRARCSLLDGNAAEAEPIFRELTQADAPSHVLAGAWNGLGDLYSEKGRLDRNIDLVVDGAYGYLRGVVQYTPVIGDPTVEHERALSGASRCFKYISELEQNVDRKKQYADRSQSLNAELLKEYPTSGFLPKSG